MSLDDLLERASSSDFAAYDPGPVIEAVNALVPLGNDAAFDALDRFVAHRDLDANPHDGLFLVLRVAFETEHHPPMRLGGAPIEPPKSPAAIPRFPIAMINDVPVMLIRGYALAGMPEPLSVHLDYYRAHGKLRATRLAPVTGVDREAAFATLYHDAYGAAPPSELTAFVAGQLAKLKS